MIKMSCNIERRSPRFANKEQNEKSIKFKMNPPTLLQELQWLSDSAIANTLCMLHRTLTYSISSVSGFVN